MITNTAHDDQKRERANSDDFVLELDEDFRNCRPHLLREVNTEP